MGRHQAIPAAASQLCARLQARWQSTDISLQAWCDSARDKFDGPQHKKLQELRHSHLLSDVRQCRRADYPQKQPSTSKRSQYLQ